MQPRSTSLPGSIRGNVRVCFLQGELTVSYQVGDNTEQRRRLKLDTRGWRVSKRRARSCPSARTYLQMERAGVETSLPNLLHIQEGRMVFGATESSRNSPPAPRQRHPHGSNNSCDHKSGKEKKKVQFYRRCLLQQPGSSVCSSRASR